MKRVLKKIFIAAAGAVLFLILILAIASVIFFYKKDLVRRGVEKLILQKTGFVVEIGKLDYELFPLSVEAHSVRTSLKIAETDVEVLLQRLSAKGDLRRVWKKMKPYLDSVEIDGLSARVAVKIARKKIELQEIIQGLSQGLSFVQKVGLKNSSLEFAFSSQVVRLESLDFLLSRAEEAETFTFALSSSRITGKVSGPHPVSFRTSLDSSGEIAFGAPPSLGGRFCFGAFHTDFRSKPINLDRVDLQVKAEFPPGRNSVLFPLFQLDLPPLLSVEGPLHVDFSREMAFQFYPKLDIKDFQKIHVLFAPFFSSSFKELGIRGSAFFEGEVRSQKDIQGQKILTKGELSVKPASVSCSTPFFSAGATLFGKFKISGFLPALDVSGKLQLKQSRFSSEKLMVESASIEIPLEFHQSSSILRIPKIKGELASVRLSFKDRNLALDPFNFKGSMAFHMNRMKLDPFDFEIEIASFPPIRVEARGDLRPGGSKEIQVQWKTLDSSSLFERFQAFSPEVLKAWEPAAEVSIEVRAQSIPFQSPSDSEQGSRISEKWNVTTEVSSNGLQLHDPDYTFAAESLQPELLFSGVFPVPLAPLDSIPFSLSFRMRQGETLWKDYYVNWAKMPVEAGFEGVFHASPRKIEIGTARIEFFGLGSFHAQGSVDLEGEKFADMVLSVEDLSLSSLYDVLRPGSGRENPLFEIRGKGESQIRFQKTKEALSLKGHLFLEDGHIQGRNGSFSLEKIEAEIPLLFERKPGFPSKTAPDKPFGKGSIHLEGLHTPFFALSHLRLEISSFKNRFVTGPLELSSPLFGGRCALGPAIIFLDTGGRTFEGRFSFSLHDVNLSEIPFQSETFQLSGRASIGLPSIRITPSRIQTTGQAEIESFGGKIAVTGISVENPFSKNRTFSCNVDFASIDLEKLTDALPFGRVTGVVGGEVEDLSIAYGQPESFILRLESEKRKGTPQKFSLKAANDLAVISSGEKTSFSPKKGWTRFVSDFRYKKIGIFCSLKNDVFSLRGTIQEKGVEYLVKNSWIFGISVINKSPQNKIRFKDMLSRLKRVGRSH